MRVGKVRLTQIRVDSNFLRKNEQLQELLTPDSERGPTDDDSGVYSPD